MEAVWQLFQDVARWPRWNAGIEDVALEGPFAEDTYFTMKPPGQDALRSRLTEVRENERFTDETRVDELVVRVSHRIERLDAERARVTYGAALVGPGAAHVGPAITADFPDVLAALVKLAESEKA